MSTIFISYRRSTDADVAGRLRDRLGHHFDVEDLFRDRESIRAGDDWQALIDDSLRDCKVCLVIIGPEWVDVTDDEGVPRLFCKNDWVRYEIDSALKATNTEVIPLLVKEAGLPKERELPPEAHGLLGRKAKRLSEDDWDADSLQLIGRIQDLTGLTKVRKRMTSALVVMAGGVLFGLLASVMELNIESNVTLDTHLGYLAIMAAAGFALLGRSFLGNPQRGKWRVMVGVFCLMSALGGSSIVLAFLIWGNYYTAGLLDSLVGVAIIAAGGLFLIDARKIARGA